MTEIDAQEIMTQTFKQAFKQFNVLKLAEPKLEKEYQKIRYGIKIKFDVYNYFDGNYKLKDKQYKIKSEEQFIIIEGKKILFKEFNTELEEREALTKSEILINMKEESVIQKR